MTAENGIVGGVPRKPTRPPSPEAQKHYDKAGEHSKAAKGFAHDFYCTHSPCQCRALAFGQEVIEELEELRAMFARLAAKSDEDYRRDYFLRKGTGVTSAIMTVKELIDELNLKDNLK